MTREFPKQNSIIYLPYKVLFISYDHLLVKNVGLIDREIMVAIKCQKLSV